MSRLNEESLKSLLYLKTLLISGYDFYHPCSRNHSHYRTVRFYDSNNVLLGRYYLSSTWQCDYCKPALYSDFDFFCKKIAAFHVTKDNEVYAVCTF